MMRNKRSKIARNTTASIAVVALILFAHCTPPDEEGNADKEGYYETGTSITNDENTPFLDVETTYVTVALGTNDRTNSVTYYDEHHRLSGEEHYEYDDGGALAKIRYFDSNNTQTSYARFLTDESGRPKNRIEYTMNDTLVSDEDFQYNANGWLIKQDGYDNDGTKWGYEYLYDENGHLKQVYTYHDLHPPKLMEYSYTTNGVREEGVQYAIGTEQVAVGRTRYFYDENGLLINEHHYDSNDILTSKREYRYR